MVLISDNNKWKFKNFLGEAFPQSTLTLGVILLIIKWYQSRMSMHTIKINKHIQVQ